MLAQFQSKYPQGSLISELVQIYHGKYIVRASIQIDGVTRSTGMAAAETLEEAEDRARMRALIVVGITEESVESPKPVKQVQPTPSLITTNSLKESAYSPTLNIPQTEATPALPAVSSVTGNTKTKSPEFTERATTYDQDEFDTFSSVIGKTKSPEFTERATTYFPDEFDISLENLGIVSDNEPEPEPEPETKTISGISPTNVTPFPSRSYSSLQEDVGTQTTTKKKKKSEPVDQSDDIAKIGVEMQRLGWTTDQGRDYLIKTYGKRSRHLLTDDELHDFLRYLESQPTPPDPLAGF